MKKSIRLTSLLLGLMLAFAFGCTAHAQAAQKSTEASSQGSYKVVGIGPGDADLLTLRALETIRKADLVFCSTQNKEKLSPYVNFAGKQVLDGYAI
jgi:hypothetical protein